MLQAYDFNLNKTCSRPCSFSLRISRKGKVWKVDEVLEYYQRDDGDRLTDVLVYELCGLNEEKAIGEGRNK
jgi:hypothetical protein